MAKSTNTINPKHYKNPNGTQTIDLIGSVLTKEEFEGYCKGNILKYISREKRKNGTQDLQKANWYLNCLITKRKQK